MFHGDLAALHGRKRGPMALLGDTCAAGGIHRYLCLRQERLHQQGVGNHADVSAEADQRHLFNEFLFILLRQQTPQLRAAEGGLVQNGLSCAGRPELLDDLPALGPPDAVGYRQVPPLPGMEIVRPMGVPGEENPLPPADACGHPLRRSRHDPPRLRCPQSAGHKVVLHIHNNQDVHYDLLLFIIIADAAPGRKTFPRGEKNVDFSFHPV